MMSKLRRKRSIKFISPCVSGTSGSCQMTPQQPITLLTADVTSTGEISQGISVVSFMKQREVKDEHLKSNTVHHYECGETVLPNEAFLTICSTPKRSNASLFEVKSSQDGNECAYNFPESPIPRPITKSKIIKSKAIKKKSAKPLINYVLATLTEIREIRLKRKVLKEQGITGYRKYKAILLKQSANSATK